MTERNNSGLGRADKIEDQGYLSAETIQRLENHFQPMLKDESLQGASWLIAQGGKILTQKAMGNLRWDGPQPLTKDSLRPIYSLSKMFTTLGILQLMEQGKLYLSSCIKDFIEEFDCHGFKDISIFHLLTHTSGYFADQGQMLEPYQRSPWEGGFPQDYNWIKKGLTSPRLAKPGERWIYSSFGYDILGEVIERVSGQKLADYVGQNIFIPLGMDRSFYHVPANLQDQVGFTSQREQDRMTQTRLEEIPPGSSGVYSTCEDLFKLGQALLQGGQFRGKRILGRRTVEIMRSNQLKDQGVALDYWGAIGKDYPYGLGVSFFQSQDCPLVSPGTYGHEGAGFSVLQIDPSEDLVVVYFVPSPLGYVHPAVVGTRNIIWSGLQ